MKRLVLSALLTLPFAAFAEGDHCHVQSPSGALNDAPAAKDQKACEAATGTWMQGTQHCTKANAGKAQALTAKTQKDCTAAGGKWTEHK